MLLKNNEDTTLLKISHNPVIAINFNDMISVINLRLKKMIKNFE